MVGTKHVAKISRSFLARGRSPAFLRPMAIMLTKAVGSLSALLAAAVLARFLVSEDLGRYGTFVATGLVLGVVAEFGQRNLLTREISKLQQGIRGLFIRSFMAVTLLGFVIGLAWYLLRDPTDGFPLSYVVMVLLWAWLGMLEGALLGAGRPVASSLGSQTVRPVCFAGLIMVLLLTAKLDLPLVILAYLGSLAISVLFAAFKLAMYPRNVNGCSGPDDSIQRSWVLESLSFLVLSFVMVLGTKLDILLLGYITGPESIGAYFNATIFAVLPQFALSSANTSALPGILKSYLEGDNRAMAEGARSAVVFAVVLSIPLASVGLFVYYILSELGWALPEGMPLLAVLMMGQLVNAAGGCCGQLLSVTGNQRTVIRAQLISLIVAAISIIGLTPVLGHLGAAIGTVAGFVVWNLLLVNASTRLIGVDTSIRSAFGHPKTNHDPEFETQTEHSVALAGSSER